MNDIPSLPNARNCTPNISLNSDVISCHLLRLSCHRLGAENFEVALTFLDNLAIPVYAFSNILYCIFGITIKLFLFMFEIL